MADFPWLDAVAGIIGLAAWWQLIRARRLLGMRGNAVAQRCLDLEREVTEARKHIVALEAAVFGSPENPRHRPPPVPAPKPVNTSTRGA